jgi:hypothetical protein
MLPGVRGLEDVGERPEKKGMAVQVRWARRRRKGSQVEMEKGSRNLDR